jgi:hypothetical protein
VTACTEKNHHRRRHARKQPVGLIFVGIETLQDAMGGLSGRLPNACMAQVSASSQPGDEGLNTDDLNP